MKIMNELDRILLECRYLLSLNKNYDELALIFNTDYKTIYNDLEVKLPKIDTILYKKVHVLNKRK